MFTVNLDVLLAVLCKVSTSKLSESQVIAVTVFHEMDNAPEAYTLAIDCKYLNLFAEPVWAVVPIDALPVVVNEVIVGVALKLGAPALAVNIELAAPCDVTSKAPVPLP